MPYKKRYKRKTYRRKKVNKNLGFTASTGYGLTPSNPFKRSFKFRTRYFETGVQLNPGVGGTASYYVYNLSSLFDPNRTGIGHQPIGFDEMMGIYQYYTVIGARARVTFTNQDTSNDQLVVLQIKAHDSASADVANIIENGRCVWNTVTKSDGSSDSEKTMTINYSANKFFSKNVVGDADYQGDIASNPQENAWLHLYAQPSVPGTDSGLVQATVLIEYIAVMTDPLQIAQS